MLYWGNIGVLLGQFLCSTGDLFGRVLLGFIGGSVGVVSGNIGVLLRFHWGSVGVLSG